MYTSILLIQGAGLFRKQKEAQQLTVRAVKTTSTSRMHVFIDGVVVVVAASRDI